MFVSWRGVLAEYATHALWYSCCLWTGKGNLRKEAAHFVSIANTSYYWMTEIVQVVFYVKHSDSIIDLKTTFYQFD